MEELALALVRGLRGTRSWAQLSRRMGYRSNVASRWDRGQRWPALGAVLRGAARLGVDVGRVVAVFQPTAAAAFDPAHPDRVAGWLRALASPLSRAELAERSGLSVHQLGRLLRGDAEGRLPEALALIEGATGRAAELVALLCEPAEVAARREAIERATAWARDRPWGPAAAAVLRTLPADRTRQDAIAAVAARLRLSPDEAEAEVDALAGVRPADAAPLESDRRRQRRHQASVLADRALAPAPDDAVSALTLVVSRAELARIQELHRAFVAEVRAIADGCRKPEVAGQLLVAWTGWEP